MTRIDRIFFLFREGGGGGTGKIIFYQKNACFSRELN